MELRAAALPAALEAKRCDAMAAPVTVTVIVAVAVVLALMWYHVFAMALFCQSQRLDGSSGSTDLLQVHPWLST